MAVPKNAFMFCTTINSYPIINHAVKGAVGFMFVSLCCKIKKYYDPGTLQFLFVYDLMENGTPKICCSKIRDEQLLDQEYYGKIRVYFGLRSIYRSWIVRKSVKTGYLCSIRRDLVYE